MDETTLTAVCIAITAMSTLANNVMNYRLNTKADRNHAAVANLHDCIDEANKAAVAAVTRAEETAVTVRQTLESRDERAPAGDR